jgi:hypothetical protein
MNVPSHAVRCLADEIEALASCDPYAAAPPQLRATAMRIGGATALCMPSVPVSHFNRVIGEPKA